MAGMNVDEAALAKAKGDVQVAVDKIRDLVNSAQRDAEGIKAGWGGRANRAFLTVADAWNQESIKVNGLLDNIQAAIGTTQTKTASAEDEATSNVGNVSGLLGNIPR
ncbi:WXG100 family type VII secretion target [Nocardia sp. BMG51109]|uniref:WXG100 family type VII secretion target n=1 Tax=Nocardia sp. BMG51109 TaxID=1056816 RepID=UPI0004643062|nr:WXG100 family type VII secretion target [Nocardia sp. BMG51109]